MLGCLIREGQRAYQVKYSNTLHIETEQQINKSSRKVYRLTIPTCELQELLTISTRKERPLFYVQFPHIYKAHHPSCHLTLSLSLSFILIYLRGGVSLSRVPFFVLQPSIDSLPAQPIYTHNTTHTLLPTSKNFPQRTTSCFMDVHPPTHHSYAINLSLTPTLSHPAGPGASIVPLLVITIPSP